MIMLFIFLHIYFVYVDFVSLKETRQKFQNHLTLTKDSCHFTLIWFLFLKELFLVICTCSRNININKYVYIYINIKYIQYRRTKQISF